MHIWSPGACIFRTSDNNPGPRLLSVGFPKLGSTDSLGSLMIVQGVHDDMEKFFKHSGVQSGHASIALQANEFVHDDLYFSTKYKTHSFGTK